MDKAATSAIPTGGGGATLFLPDRVLQGSRIPGYLRWPGTPSLALLRIESSVALDVVEVHNGAAERDSVHAFDLRQTEAVPYVGFVLDCDTLAASTDCLDLKVRWQLEGGVIEEVARSLAIYRPLLHFRSAPDVSTVEISPKGYATTGRYQVENQGQGTAIVSFHPAEGSSTKLSPSVTLKEFQEGFIRDLLGRLPTLASDHPKHATALDMFPKMIFSVRDVRDPKHLAALDDYLAELSEAVANDDDFGRDLSDSVVWAFTRNFQTTLLMEQFVEFMRSLGSSRVILVNPLDTIDLHVGENEVSLYLAQTDLERNQLDPVELPSIKVTCTEPIQLPVHKLFAFSEMTP